MDTSLCVYGQCVNEIEASIVSIPQKCRSKAVDVFYKVDKALLDLKNTYNEAMEKNKLASGEIDNQAAIVPVEPEELDEEEEPSEEANFKSLLKEKIRREFHQKLPERYWSLLQTVENPSDDREILRKLALDAGIPIIMRFFTNNSGRNDYEIGILWNEVPKLVGVQGSAKQIRDKAAEWKRSKWVESDFLIEKSLWEGSGEYPEPLDAPQTAQNGDNLNAGHMPSVAGGALNTTETAQNDIQEGARQALSTFVAAREDYSGRITDKSIFLKLEGIPELLFNLNGSKL